VINESGKAVKGLEKGVYRGKRQKKNFIGG